MRRIALALALGSGALPAGAAPPSVQTHSGTVVGEEVDAGVQAFLGIPYAAPPIGARRWRPPEPPQPWTAAREATRFGAACPQPDDPLYGYTPRPQSEDCLYLNVWAPAQSAHPLPVMVWLHGGAHRMGAASLPFYDGSRLARRGVVVVTLNYRLGYLGYFAHPALAAERGGGNFGLMDQIAALNWVRDNIAAFGGDPEQVTIFGESAGGADVLYLMTNPAAQGLFQRAIVQSGGGWHHPLTRDAMTAAVLKQLRRAGIRDDAGIQRLRGLDARRLIDAQHGDRELGFGPFLDGATVSEAPYRAFEQGREAPVPLIVGSNSWEANLMKFSDPGLKGAILARLPPVYAWYRGQADTAEQRKQLLFRDFVFAAPARWLAARHSLRAPSFLYEFDHVSAGRRGQVPGAGHGTEIGYVFDTLDATQRSASNDQSDRALAAALADCWTAFARRGVPSCALPVWRPYDPAADNVYEIDGAIGPVRRSAASTLDAIQHWFGPGGTLGPPL